MISAFEFSLRTLRVESALLLLTTLPSQRASFAFAGASCANITDASGKRYHLVGYNAKQIGEHIGHTVEITGMPTVKTTNTTQQGLASSAKESPVFKVQSIKHIADTCKSM